MYTSRRESKFGWDGTLYSRETRTRRVIYTSKQYPALTEDMTVVVRLGAGQRANIQSIIIIPDSWSNNYNSRFMKHTKCRCQGMEGKTHSIHTLYRDFDISIFDISIQQYAASLRDDDITSMLSVSISIKNTPKDGGESALDTHSTRTIPCTW